MDKQTLIYLVFGIVLVVALVLDLGLLSKKNKVIGMKQALIQTCFWVALALSFGIFVWYENVDGQGKTDAIQYISAYLLEWSLSIDNIFVFIIIFNYFRVREENYGYVLLLGILMAIVFRIAFIAIGSELVARFGWIMYVFGIFLLVTGLKMFKSGEDEEFDPGKNWAYKILTKILPTTNAEPNGKLMVKQNGKTLFTSLAIVVCMLGLIDIVFAIDSIPAVFSIIPDPNKKLLIYSSNIFAVLGLRSLFFLLKGAASKFEYLQQGIAIVLVFIGLKMMLPALKYVGLPEMHIAPWVSLLMILLCIGGSIIYSIISAKKKEELGIVKPEEKINP